MKKSNTGKEMSRHAKEQEQRRRILILDDEKAKPNSAAWHFLEKQSRACGKGCIKIIRRPDLSRKIVISEDACAVCLTRARKCPGGAVKVVNLPSNLTTDTTHRYGTNAFKLHGLPMPRPGHVLGLLGGNGTGKSTALSVLSGNLTPNLGADSWSVDATPPTWQDIVRYYRGSDLQNYFRKLALENTDKHLRSVLKPQLEPAVVRRFVGRRVGQVLRERDERRILEKTADKLELTHLFDRQVQELSGGELQRFAVCACVIRDVDVYLFDETSSFLDVRQRLLVSDVIRSLVDSETYRVDGRDMAEAEQIANSKYVVIVEHDLTVLDYVSDYVCCLYGEPGAYGVVTSRSTTARGINQFIAGHISTENIRFRAEELTFQVPVQDTDILAADNGSEMSEHSYPAMYKALSSNPGGSASDFKLHVEAGTFRDGEIIGMLGQNGVGKSTFFEMLAAGLDGKTAGLDRKTGALQSLGTSYKRQHLAPRFRRFRGTVRDYLEAHVQNGLGDRLFRLLVMKPLLMDKMEDLPVQSLSGGELQRLAICVCLGAPAGMYLIDEPSAGLDCEQRLVVAKVVRRWVVSHLGATAFVIEHDMAMASAMYDRVVVYSGSPGVECTASAPLPLSDGLNAFLRQLGVTFKIDRNNRRPRINKRGSRLDREQKAAGVYFSSDFIGEAVGASVE